MASLHVYDDDDDEDNMMMVMTVKMVMIFDLNQGDIGHHFLVNKAAKSGMVGGRSLLTGVVRSLQNRV